MNYKAYGLRIQSEIDLSELLPFKEEGTDVRIALGKVPDRSSLVTKGCDWFTACKNKLFIDIEHTAKYYIVNGELIIVEPYEDADDQTIKLYLLGTALPGLLMQRSILPIHGSGIVIDGKCIIVAGCSGSGKSSLSLSLLKRGYEFLSDDVVPISIENDSIPYAYFSYPQQKVTQKTATFLGIETNSLIRVEEEEKFFLPVNRDQYIEKVPLNAMFVLSPYDHEEVRIREITGINKVMEIVSNTYNIQMINPLEMSKEHFQFCAKLSESIKVYQLFRPIDKFTVDQQIELIINEIKNID